MKGYIMYKVGHITFKKEYIKDFNQLNKVDLFIRYINFKSGIIKDEQVNVDLVFKNKVITY